MKMQSEGRLKDRVFLASPTMHGEEERFVKEAFDTNWVAPLGTNVNELEKEVAAFVGVSHAAALTAGTAALHLAVKLAEVQHGDIVFCSDLTFAATVNPVSYEDGYQVFIDSEWETWNMDPNALRRAFIKYDGTTHEDGKFYPKPKAVIVANLYGTPAKLDEIKELCREYDTLLIEDAAESLSATYKGVQTGTFGKYNAISFNGNKIITTSGGGMFLSDDEEAVKKVRFWATQSRENYPWYEHREMGYNYRMSNVVAGIGRGQLLHLNEHKELKKKIYMRYLKAFEDMPVQMNPYLECSEPNFWLSCMLLEKEVVEGTSKEFPKVTPEMIRRSLEQYNIESRPIWKPMHLQPVYADRDFIMAESWEQERGHKNSTYGDVAEMSLDGSVGGEIFRRGICLPSDIKMDRKTQEIVIQIIKGLFRK